MKNQKSKPRKVHAAKVNQIKYNPNNSSTIKELKQINIDNFIDGANWEKKQIIDLICNWLSENTNKYIKDNQINIELLIEDLKKEISDI